MTEEVNRTRWIWLALGLPAATLVAFAIALRLGADRAFYNFTRSYLPPSLTGFIDGAPFFGWILLTVACSGWLCHERARERGMRSGRRWALVIVLTPFLAVLHAIASMMVAWPGCMAIGSF